MTNHIDDLYAILESAPDDWDTRRVLADAMEEAGDSVGAEGQRWQVENGKYAAGYGKEIESVTWSLVTYYLPESPNHLPNDILAQWLSETSWLSFRSLREAERWLAERLHEMKRA